MLLIVIGGAMIYISTNLLEGLTAKMITKYPERLEYPPMPSRILRGDFIPDARGELNVDSGNCMGGVSHLNGNQAVAYERIRNVGTDFACADRQHKVLSGLIGQLMDMALPISRPDQGNHILLRNITGAQ